MRPPAAAVINKASLEGLPTVLDLTAFCAFGEPSNSRTTTNNASHLAASIASSTTSGRFNWRWTPDRRRFRPPVKQKLCV
jgi:hypothetical protein